LQAASSGLVELRDRFASRIQRAEDTANDLLDEELARRPDHQVVKVETHLRGREVQSREQLNAVLKELEEQIGPLVDQGTRVRIV
jgi:translation initiation factor IF-3